MQGVCRLAWMYAGPVVRFIYPNRLLNLNELTIGNMDRCVFLWLYSDPCGSGAEPRSHIWGVSETPRRALRGQSPLPQAAVCQVQRSVFFAGRARSHKLRCIRYSAVCPSRAEPAPTSCGVSGTAQRVLRGQSPLPQAAVYQVQRSVFFAGRARSHKLRCIRYSAVCPSRAEPAPTSCGVSGTAQCVLRGQDPLPQSRVRWGG
ncbi:hypothetical protein SAMN05216510_0010 [Pseudomonas coleopterorum]|nr:hypothetical protein SAMN05216510_0010 [Pseudomonas coleopterorum]